MAATTVRLRVSGSVIFIVTTAGTGKGVERGTSTKDVESSETVKKTDIAASDKIGMAIEGKLAASKSTRNM